MNDIVVDDRLSEFKLNSVVLWSLVMWLFDSHCWSNFSFGDITNDEVVNGSRIQIRLRVGADVNYGTITCKLDL